MKQHRSIQSRAEQATKDGLSSILQMYSGLVPANPHFGPQTGNVHRLYGSCTCGQYCGTRYLDMKTT